MIFRSFAIFVLPVLLAGCFSAQVSLDYLPRPGMHLTGRSEIGVGHFYDNRGVPPYYLCTSRSAIGTPSEHVLLRVPADEAVKNAFLHALEARGMLADGPSQKYYLAGEVEVLRASIVQKPFAEAVIRLHVLQTGSDKILFRRTYSAQRSAAGFMFGYEDTVQVLRELTSRTLQDAVDKALDDPALRKAIRARKY